MQEAALFDRVWGSYEQEFDAALNEEDVSKAHRIWCRACEDFLWQLQGESKQLPRDKPRRGEVLPTEMQDAANVMNCHTRSARNAFSNSVDRTLGLANDLKNRIRRLTTHKDEVKRVEYHPHS